MTPDLRRLSDDELRAHLDEYAWYHRISLRDGVVTPGVERYEPYQAAVLHRLRQLDVRGKRVLDVGCRDGLFAFEAERMGAAAVVGIDNNLSKGAVELLVPYFGSKIELLELNLVDLEAETLGPFDVVLLAGVLYHLRFPFWGLRRVADVLVDGGRLLLETALLIGRSREPLLWCPTGRDSPYEPSSVSFFNERGLTDTLRTFGIAVDELSRLGRRERRRRFRGRAVDRATLLCTKHEELADRELARYWSSAHNRRSWS